MGIDIKSTHNYINPTTKVLKTYDNEPSTLHALSSGVASYVPILLSTLLIKFNISHLIRLPEKAVNINTIKNRFFLKNCSFLQENDLLFLKGFIRKKIYYTSSLHKSLRYYQIDIPFECTTTVILNKSFNNKFFFELISSEVTEQCRYICETNNTCYVNTLDLKEIIEIDNNMSITLKIHAYQNQQVYIKPYYTDKENLNFHSNKPDSNDKNCIIDKHNNETKSGSKDNAVLESKSNLFNETDKESKSASDYIYSKLNTYDKLDIYYLLNYYNKPDDTESNLLDNHYLNDNPILNNKAQVNNKFIKNNKINSNNYSNHSYSAYNHRLNSYKFLILILCIFMLFNINNYNSHI